MKGRNNRTFSKGTGGLIAATILLFTGPGDAGAQELEPRRWSNLPIETSFAGGGYAFTTGDIALDPVLQAQDVVTEIHSALFKYTHIFEFSDQVARFDFIQAYQDASWSGTVSGAPRSRIQSGFSDTVLRLSMNLVGDPPLTAPEFAARKKSGTSSDTVIGVGFAVHLPTGVYDETKLLNLGTNRFTFRPQIGLSHTCGPWTFEIDGEIWLYTDNDEFWNGNHLDQAPLLATQAHVVYTFKPGLWLATGLAYGDGASATVNGIPKHDTRRNLAFGASVGLPIDRQTGIKIGYIGFRTQENIGTDLDNFIFALSRMW